MTVQLKPTLQQALDQADPNTLGDILNQVKLGSMVTPLKQTIAALASSATVDITSAAVAAAATPGPNTNKEPAGTTLPPILSVVSLRVTTGTAHALPHIVTDVGGTAQDNSSGVSVATLSDDGKTLVFGAAVTGFVIEYIPRAAADMQSLFESGA